MAGATQASLCLVEKPFHSSQAFDGPRFVLLPGPFTTTNWARGENLVRGESVFAMSVYIRGVYPGLRSFSLNVEPIGAFTPR